ncbi:hypothetical protein NRIC_05270 [Enterococcus florum]|uniref:Putative aromatic acid exporter C-terminal domain-containing protein n=1 Tax=Enterococcus florum TaxID=2480627 RepID=A0A4P5P5C5_9ENTE|nr:aromatic acid exporter family protein [Enterococcus florum]GCF92636.1 hypothetical protein NRIC_05270 [Enterococcus florum]
MKIPTHFDIGNKFLHGIKIGLGSALAMFLAEQMRLEFVSSAGIITLLTITGTKVEAKRLCFHRFLTFFVTILISWLIFECIQKNWVSFGIVIMIIAFFSTCLSLLSTLSVNAVIATHLLIQDRINFLVLKNEFLLLLIGMGIAILVNQIHDHQNQREALDHCLEQTEKSFQKILFKLSCYLKNEVSPTNVWNEICELEKALASFRTFAFQYQQNRLPEIDDYYSKYFEMRTQQCGILHNLHYELKKLRTTNKESEIVAEYFNYIREYLDESNHPVEQLRHLEHLVNNISHDQLPQTQTEFYSKARLYHILMDIQEFLTFKKRFIESINELPKEN